MNSILLLARIGSCNLPSNIESNAERTAMERADMIVAERSHEAQNRPKSRVRLSSRTNGKKRAGAAAGNQAPAGAAEKERFWVWQVILSIAT
ncbi:hypothetical protein [Dyadobacter fanqingshengii]|uniref:Uncharacterized protein n=1 Tax=Dyadobacter fanqingshengii TaxID=2906443 RepID=A0A9X1P8J8_9BACT|nr:hypothetical protein [Dyadobacter fanqingshengii]MCF0040376.1 hypothetical protein [Dyadobacter fanqingshengii]UTM21847.1 hypothetical protein NFI81_26240 [Dyadobacter fanqingshengii]